MDKCANGGHRVSARGRINVLHLDAVPGIEGAVAIELLQNHSRARVRIVENRRRQARMVIVDRHEVAAVPRMSVAFVLPYGLYLFGIPLGETRIQIINQRKIQTVHPHGWGVAQVSVVVIGPGWSENEVAGVHRRSLTFNGGICTIALHDQTQRSGCMPMRRRHLSWKNELKAGMKSVCDLGFILDSRIRENQHPPIRFFCGDQFAGFHEKRPHLFITPQCRNSLGPRLNRNDVRKIFPERSGVLRLEPLVEVTKLAGCFRFLIKARGVHQAARTSTSIVPIFSIVATIVSPG